MIRAVRAGAVDVRHAQRQARRWQRRFIGLIALSALVFLVGAMIALSGVLPDEVVSEEPDPSTPAAATTDAEIGGNARAPARDAGAGRGPRDGGSSATGVSRGSRR